MITTISNKKFNNVEELEKFTKFLFIHRQKDRREKMSIVKDLAKQYEKEYRETREENIALKNKLRQYHINTEFSVDHIFFTNWHTNEVVYCFEL